MSSTNIACNIATKELREGKNEYSVEYYTKHPQTGETGWDISYITLRADSKKDIPAKLKNYDKNFDCVITAWNTDFC